jgi:hypothetical protein
MPDIHVMANGSAVALIGPGGTIIVKQSTLGLLTELLIDFQNISVPDPDLEPEVLEDDDPAELDGDEHDGDPRAEDEFTRHAHAGPGCPCSDPDYGAEEAGESEEGV